MVLADIFKRWQQLKGNEAYLCTGTDEHGMKIQRAAEKAEVSAKELCDENSAKFRDLAQAAAIDHDFFIRTTDTDHKEAVGQFWLRLKHTVPQNLGIYKGKHEGWYCVSDECFYPEDLVAPSIEPQTGKKIMISTETENQVEWMSEETWFFPLTKYKQRLLDFYAANPDWIMPRTKLQEVRNWVENNLEDLSVTRPVSRLTWGIRDPEDHTQTIYVWVDALINYLTKAGYGSAWHTPKEDTGIWPADMHVVGKDIIRFHAVYWPALLMALDMPLPKRILCHPHWTMSGRKMSKSIGNVVDPMLALERWGIDSLRYFLVRSGRSGTYDKDMAYSNQLMEVVYAKELQANIGNLFQRIARPKTGKWSTYEATRAYREGKFQLSTEDEERLAPLHESMTLVSSAVRDAMDGLNTAEAIDQIFNLLKEVSAPVAVKIRSADQILHQANRTVSVMEPWTLAKICEEDPANEEARTRLNKVIYYVNESLRIAGILLQPIMPAKMTELLDSLGVSNEQRTFQHAALGIDDSYGIESAVLQERGIVGKHPLAVATLFPPQAGIDRQQPGFSGKKGKGNLMHRTVKSIIKGPPL